mmetsp:Transcript_33760/g.132690  ORF Transcript_33760/g.132690 Transcript_33760/m.132690 type:complete len:285 (+) Transcript_33760:937-1791(+)
MFMVLCQCAVGSVTGKAIVAFVSTETGVNSSKADVPQYKFSLCAFAVLSSMVLSNAAIQFISYPLQVLAKSCKMIPVMFIGKLILRRVYTIKDYARVFLLTAGVVLFSNASVKLSNTDVDALWSHGALGLSLVVAALCFDGVGGPYAERTCKEYGTTSHELMLYQNLWSVPILIAGILVHGELGYIIGFIGKHPEVLMDLFMFSLSSSAGQVFVFYILRNYSALICTAVTTTRKFFTVLVSIVYYNHSLSLQQWLAVLMVFGGILWEAVDHIAQKTSVTRIRKG